MLSYFFSIALKSGNAVFESKNMTNASTGIAAKMITESLGLIRYAITEARMSINGARASMRMIIWNEF